MEGLIRALSQAQEDEPEDLGTENGRQEEAAVDQAARKGGIGEEKATQKGYC